MSASYAILLGASKFPRYAEFHENAAFEQSANDFLTYLSTGDAGLGIGAARVLNLFNAPGSPGEQLYEINAFLRDARADPSFDSANLVVYYVGHGLLAGRNQDYYLAIGSLNDALETSTALRFADLADVLKQGAYDFRRYLFVDACFSERSVRESMGAVESLIQAKAVAPLEEDGDADPSGLPARGTALFCSADKDSVARSPIGSRRTTFSDALLTVLEQGDPTRGRATLSLQEVFEITRSRLKRDPKAPLPVIHSPDQRDGDIASIRLFPNNAYRPREASLPDASSGAPRVPAARPVEPEPEGSRAVAVESAAAPKKRVATPPKKRSATPPKKTREETPGASAWKSVAFRRAAGASEEAQVDDDAIAPVVSGTRATALSTTEQRVTGIIVFALLSLVLPPIVYVLGDRYHADLHGLYPHAIACVALFAALFVQGFVCYKVFGDNIARAFPAACGVEFLAFACVANGYALGWMDFAIAVGLMVYAVVLLIPTSMLFGFLERG